MSNDIHVYLLTGPRAAGKSEYSKKLLAAQQDLHLVSRDEIMVRLFGSEHSDPYSGGHFYATEEMYRVLCQNLSAQGKVRIVLDTWTGESSERKALLMKLRGFGATRVTALYFITPIELVDEWFWKKPGIAKMGEMRGHQGEGLVFYSEDAPRRDYQMFHKLAFGIDSDGFDVVVRVNPTQPIITLK